jgi:hypothetical protein
MKNPKKIKSTYSKRNIIILIGIEWIIAIILAVFVKAIYAKTIELRHISVVAIELFFFLFLKLLIFYFLQKFAISYLLHKSKDKSFLHINIISTFLMLLILIFLKSSSILDLSEIKSMFTLRPFPIEGGGFFIIGRGYYLIVAPIISYYICMYFKNKK